MKNGFLGMYLAKSNFTVFEMLILGVGEIVGGVLKIITLGNIGHTWDVTIHSRCITRLMLAKIKALRESKK